MYNESQSAQGKPQHIKMAEDMAIEIFKLEVKEQVDAIQELKSQLYRRRMQQTEENLVEIEKLQVFNKVLAEGNQIILTESSI